MTSAATETDGAELHREFCRFLKGVLTATDSEGVPLITPSWGAVIRAFLKDNSITMVPDSGPMEDLAKEWATRRPPRGGLDTAVDFDD